MIVHQNTSHDDILEKIKDLTTQKRMEYVKDVLVFSSLRERSKALTFSQGSNMTE